ncbi:MAG TPA: ATP-grasp domain-containing protein [Candidatus Paceibacterota bacterium]|nr:ATP-grasp domain-containing protein [Candidatus Paceibacterota bacterium]
MSPIRVGVLRGGLSSEYEVSLETGKSVIAALAEHPTYTPVDVFIDKAGDWHLHGTPIDPADITVHVDVVFNALHGAYGEDGRVQQILGALKVPYTGSDVLGSALATHKARAKELFKKEGIPVSPSAVFSTERGSERELREIFRTISGPYVIKPVSGGLSVGVHLARSYPELYEKVYGTADPSVDVLIEQFISGREATCSIVDGFRGEKHYALLPVEIVPPLSSSFFDYDAKYSGASQEVCPGRFSHEETRTIQEYAKKAHAALGLRDYSRSDFVVTPRGVHILETNALPALASESLLPKSLDAVGSGILEFLHHTISRAHARR